MKLKKWQKLGIELFVIFIFYLSLQFYQLSNKFIENVIINGHNISFDTKLSAIDALTNIDGYTIDVGDDLSSKEIYLKHFSKLKINTEDIDNIFKKTHSLSCMVFGIKDNTEYHIASNLVISKEKLKAQLSSLNDNRTSSRNAYIYYDYDNQSFDIQSEVIGNTFDIDMLANKICDDLIKHFKLLQQNYKLQISMDCYIYPNIVKQDLIPKLNKLNNYINGDVFQLDFGKDIKEITQNKLTTWYKKDISGLPLIEDDHIVYNKTAISNDLDRWAKEYDLDAHFDKESTINSIISYLEQDVRPDGKLHIIKIATKNLPTDETIEYYLSLLPDDLTKAVFDLGYTYEKVDSDLGNWFYGTNIRVTAVTLLKEKHTFIDYRNNANKGILHEIAHICDYYNLTKGSHSAEFEFLYEHHWEEWYTAYGMSILNYNTIEEAYAQCFEIYIIAPECLDPGTQYFIKQEIDSVKP